MGRQERAMKDRVDVVCTCCRTRLTVDTGSGEVLAEERPKLDPSRTFDEAMGEVRRGEKQRHEAFSKAFERTKNQDDLLEKKFEEARKKAAKDGGDKPRNPFDLD
jgi:hypothetical protein